MTRAAIGLALAGLLALGWVLRPVDAGSQALGSTTWVSTGLPSAFDGGTAREPARI